MISHDHDPMISLGDFSSVSGDAAPATPSEDAPTTSGVIVAISEDDSPAILGFNASTTPGGDTPAIPSDVAVPIPDDEAPLSASASTTHEIRPQLPVAGSTITPPFRMWRLPSLRMVAPPHFIATGNDKTYCRRDDLIKAGTVFYAFR